MPSASCAQRFSASSKRTRSAAHTSSSTSASTRTRSASAAVSDSFPSSAPRAPRAVRQHRSPRGGRLDFQLEEPQMGEEPLVVCLRSFSSAACSSSSSCSDSRTARASAVKCASSRPRVYPRARLLVVLTRPVVLGDPRASFPQRAAGLLLCGNQGALAAFEQMSAVELVCQCLGDTRY